MKYRLLLLSLSIVGLAACNSTTSSIETTVESNDQDTPDATSTPEAMMNDQETQTTPSPTSATTSDTSDLFGAESEIETGL